MISYIRNTVQYLDKNEKPVRFAKHTLGRKDLNMTDKVILIEIYDLCGTPKGCFAKNDYFIDGFGLSESTVSRSLKRLQESGDIVITYDNNNNDDRIIKIGGVVKLTEGCSQIDDPLDTQSAYIDDKNSDKKPSEDRSTNIEVIISKDISDKSLIEDLNDMLVKPSTPLTASNPLPPKVYGNSEINLAKEWLVKKYPKTLTEINDRIRLKNFIQALSRRKGRDEGMKEDWKENLVEFMTWYLKEKAGYETENLYKLNQIIQAWREKRGVSIQPNESGLSGVKTVNELI